MNAYRKTGLIVAAFVLFLGAGQAFAYIPEPKSEGKYFQGKGTRSSEDYEAMAGMPIYDYGKGIQWGPVHFRPTLDYKMRYDDNIFYEETGERDDLINTLFGGVDAELPLGGGQHLVTLGYNFFQEWFSDFGDQDHTDHRAKAGVKLNYVPFTLDIEDVFERTVSRSNTEFTERIQRDENAVHSLLEVPFSRFFLENEITNFTISYDRPVDTIFDHNLFTVYQRIGYDVTPSTQLLAEYAYLDVSYDNFGARDGDGNQFMLGMRGNLTELIAYQIWGGFQARSYDDSAARPDFEDFVARGALQYQPSEMSTWILRGDRVPQESTFDNQSYYTRNRAELLWRRQIAARIYWNSFGLVDFHEYSRESVIAGARTTREDWLWEAGTGLEYRFPNEIVSLTLDYRHVGRESNLTGFDYDGNQVSFGVRAAF